MKVALAGATGAVGREFIKVFEKRNFPIEDFKPLASKRSAGNTLECQGRKYVIEELTPESFEGVDVAFFSAGGSISRDFAPHVVKAGAVMIDNSSAFRMDPEVPLVIPEINPGDAKEHKGIIANPNCSTIIALMALAPIHREAGLERFIASTYQAVSGSGKAAMDELVDQLKDLIAGKEPKIEVYPHQIAFNALPHVDTFQENGFTREEMKMVNETHKILHDKDIRISTTCVRVPVMRSHSESITLQTKKKLTPDEVRNILSEAPGVIVVDKPEENRYPLATSTTEQLDVQVGRIREDAVFENGISLWVVGDQLLKGAALNAVQIGELLL